MHYNYFFYREGNNSHLRVIIEQGYKVGYGLLILCLYLNWFSCAVNTESQCDKWNKEYKVFSETSRGLNE